MSHSYRHLSRPERHLLASYLADGRSLRWIARKLGRSVSTLADEIRRNSLDGAVTGYRPEAAQVRTMARTHETNRRNPLKDLQVRFYVLEKLREDWSPEEITARMAQDFPTDLRMRISHETIYQFVSSRTGQLLGLARHLRRRKGRVHRVRLQATGDERIPGRVSIHARPSVVAAKTRYGDYESDVMQGQGHGEALSVFRERRSQYVFLEKLPDLTSASTATALRTIIRRIPTVLRKTVTFDNGKENVRHGELRRYRLRTYFCDAYCSWQKGGVENTIGLLRQYFPKGMPLELVTEEDIRAVAWRLNHRPRKSLGFRTPHEVLSAYLRRRGVRLRD
jgi:transposase, IS30 family